MLLFAPYLMKEIEIVNHKIIIPLGKLAFNFFFRDELINQFQGREMKFKEYTIFPIYHPAATLKNG
jgi:uracil-DNA glycosylase